MVWKDLIIIFYFIVCGLVASSIILILETVFNKLKDLVITSLKNALCDHSYCAQLLVARFYLITFLCDHIQSCV